MRLARGGRAAPAAGAMIFQLFGIFCQTSQPLRRGKVTAPSAIPGGGVPSADCQAQRFDRREKSFWDQGDRWSGTDSHYPTWEFGWPRTTLQHEVPCCAIIDNSVHRRCLNTCQTWTRQLLNQNSNSVWHHEKMRDKSKVQQCGMRASCQIRFPGKARGPRQTAAAIGTSLSGCRLGEDKLFSCRRSSAIGMVLVRP